MSNHQNELIKIIYILLISSLTTLTYAQTIVPGGSGWADSYSVNGKCYCSSTYDHGIGNFTVETPAGTKNVVEVCEAIGPGPGRGSNPIYNTVQCGHAPGHFDEGNHLYTDGIRRRVADEIECPGRVDIGTNGCNITGPKWDLSVFESSTTPPPNNNNAISIPSRFEAEDFTSQNGTRTENTSDIGGGSNIGHIQNGDYLSYNIDVKTSGTYKLDIRIATPRTNSQIFINIDGNSTHTFNTPNTGDWQNWQTISTEVELDEGVQNLRLDFSGNNNGLLNVNWIEATQVNSTSNPGETLNRNNWTLSSSINQNDLYNSVDSDRNSRWTTHRQTQRNGQYFVIDFNKTETFDRIVLDSARSNNDQPRAYEVYISNNGNDWGSAITSGNGDANGITVINFEQQNARFVRIEQNGSDNKHWWSIHEIEIYSDAN